MNKKMRELLSNMEAKAKEARAAQDAGETEKAAGMLSDIATLRSQYEAEKALHEAEKLVVPDEPEKPEEKDGNGLTAEEKSFLEYVTSKAASSLSAGNNGGIIPTSIAGKIIEQVKTLSPIFSLCSHYNVTGNLVIPSYGPDSGDNIQAAYAAEFQELTEHAGKFGAITLESNMVGALTKVSKKLLNNGGVEVMPFVTRKLGEAFAEFFERELLVGDGGAGHMTGATKTTRTMNAGAIDAKGVTADNLIDLQLMVPQQFQGGACWIMSKDAFAAARKLKDTTNNYLLTKSFKEGFTYEILGKPVWLSDNMPAIASGSVSILYGDFSGIALKMGKNLEVQPLFEKYATQYALGLVGWAETDAKIENAQKFAGLKFSA